MATESNDLIVRTINGREIKFQPPTDAQTLMMMRLSRIGESAMSDNGNLGDALESMSKILDIIDSMVVEPSDRSWLEQRILDRSMNLESLLSVFATENDPNANRATKRTAKKATAKKVTATKAAAKKATKAPAKRTKKAADSGDAE